MEGQTEVDPGTDSPDPSIANLDKIDQIVVLMMENRSFDHMLGYLKRDGMPEVEGLTEEHGNQHEGEFVPVWPLHEQAFDLKALDPGHGFKDVTAQLERGNQGFVKNFVESFERLRIKHPPPADFEFDPTLVLGYQTAETTDPAVTREWGRTTTSPTSTGARCSSRGPSWTTPWRASCRRSRGSIRTSSIYACSGRQAPMTTIHRRG